jgi:hypothetical protein
MLKLQICVMALAVSLPTVAAAAPPPPPPGFIGALAKRIVPTQTPNSFDQYANALGDDLKVSINGRQAAADKTAWLMSERRKLGRVDRRILGLVEGRDSILVLDRYDDRSGLPTSPNLLFDPRYKTRAVRYEIGADHLIHAIHIVETEGVIQTLP